MAVAKVKIASIIGMTSQLDETVKICGESKFFHPDDALLFYSNTSKFQPISEMNPYSDLIDRMSEVVTRAGANLKITNIDDFNVSIEEIENYIEYLTEKLSTLSDKKDEINKQIQESRNNIEQVSHFVGLDLNLDDMFTCRYVKVRFGRIPKESYSKLTFYENNPNILFYICTHDENYYWGVYVCPIDQANDIDRIFSSLYFERIRISESTSTPEEYINCLKKNIESKNKELENIDAKIKAFWKTQYDQCMRFYSKLEQLDSYFGIKKYASIYNNDSFILLGWIPESKEEEFKESLEDIDGIEYSIESADDQKKHSPPIILKNNKFFAPFEFFVEMYGLPTYGEVDPTAFVGITYILLYGIMFADLGQGLVISIFGYILYKLKKSRLGAILLRCGISSAIFGTLFSSVFGFEDLLDPFYKTVLGLKSKPIEIMEGSSIMLILVAAVSIGVVLIITAMLINIYTSFKQRKYDRAIFGSNGIAGLLFYTSLVFGFLEQMVFGNKIMTLPYVMFLLILPVISMLFSEVLGKFVQKDPNWKPESLGGYILENAFEIFEVLLSYITNTLSFLRVGVFVIVHVSMMLVFFSMAEAWPSISFIIILIGNVIVIGLEGFLVGIQVLRLEFFEMFSRFFSGGGRSFKPVTIEEKA